MAKTRRQQASDRDEPEPEIIDRDDAQTQLRAGQREDELLPGQSNEDEPANSLRGDAAGSPGGGLGATGLAGTTRGDGAPNPADIEDALGADQDDDLSDTVKGTHPQSGPSGGALGGTPAGKRAAPK
jgi:hypothetical protein